MRTRLLAAVLALSLVPAAFAQSAPPADTAAQTEQREQRREQRLAQRAERLAQKLGLDASAAARFQQSFEDFARRRKALREQTRSARQTLRAAAQGDAAAQGQVEAALGQLRSVRSQLNALRDGLYDQLSQGLNPQQKAQLLLMLQHHGKRGRFGHRHPGMGAPPAGRQ
jgi:Spy/CpxP family protein refolding chaperone